LEETSVAWIQESDHLLTAVAQKYEEQYFDDFCRACANSGYENVADSAVLTLTL
jgi:hypothetical protein